MKKYALVYAGARVALDSIKATDKQRSIAFDRIDALLEIRRLNVRSTNAWTNQNNNGRNWTQDMTAACERRQDRAWDKAQAIAKSHGWKITAPGLWWQVQERGIDITIREA